MKREYLFIIITVIFAMSGVVYKGIFVSDKLEETQELIINNNDLNAQFNRDTLTQRKSKNLVQIHKTNKKENESYGEIIAKLLEITEGILKEAKIKYDVNDIEQEIQEKIDWPNGKATYYINVNFESSYEDLIHFISLVEKHELLINIASITCYRIKPKNKSKDKEIRFDGFSHNSPMSVKIRMEYVKFL
ncbi:MAG: hypothetical protein KAS62_11000 [Candidatus Delongbacteria bacterium]|nr:hypothetical protein [Candidatus Delongbacteria bacterium]